jgi:peptidoglycan/LPS O-acetylase OafA/YrhL
MLAVGGPRHCSSLSFWSPERPQSSLGESEGVSEPMSEGKFYRPELDALRFVAFFLVFCNHGLPSRAGYHAAGLPAWLWRPLDGLKMGGSYGVDLFFLLSAYLITEILLREHRRTSTIDVRAFWVRRILRIWPLYFLFLAAAYWVVPLFYPQNFPGHMAFAYATFWGNFVAATLPSVATVAGILWSVSIEEQFYLCWPLVLRVGVRWIVPICVALLVVSNVTRFVLLSDPIDPESLWYNTFTRLDPIAVGALLASLLAGRTLALRRSTRLGFVTSALVLLVLSGMYLKQIDKLDLLAYPVASVAALLALLGFLGADWRTPPALLYLGRISYGLYVFHILAITIVRSAVDLGGGFREWAVEFPIALLMTIGLASISYRWVETPFLRIKERFSMDRGPTPVVATGTSPATAVEPPQLRPRGRWRLP